jgi:hypothetical protein
VRSVRRQVGCPSCETSADDFLTSHNDRVELRNVDCSQSCHGYSDIFQFCSGSLRLRTRLQLSEHNHPSVSVLVDFSCKPGSGLPQWNGANCVTSVTSVRMKTYSRFHNMPRSIGSSTPSCEHLVTEAKEQRSFHLSDLDVTFAAACSPKLICYRCSCVCCSNRGRHLQLSVHHLGIVRTSGWLPTSCLGQPVSNI